MFKKGPSFSFLVVWFKSTESGAYLKAGHLKTAIAWSDFPAAGLMWRKEKWTRRLVAKRKTFTIFKGEYLPFWNVFLSEPELGNIRKPIFSLFPHSAYSIFKSFSNVHVFYINRVSRSCGVFQELPWLLQMWLLLEKQSTVRPCKARGIENTIDNQLLCQSSLIGHQRKTKWLYLGK